MHEHYLQILYKSMGQVGEFHENERTSRMFWRKLISLRSMLSEYQALKWVKYVIILLITIKVKHIYKLPR